MISKDIFTCMGIDHKSLSEVSEVTGIPKNVLKYYLNEYKIPIGNDFRKLCEYSSSNPLKILIECGIIDDQVRQYINNHETTYDYGGGLSKSIHTPSYSTDYGKLYSLDCIEYMKEIPDGEIDLIFADPPFNLNKDYPSKMNDNLKEIEYLSWQEEWIKECIRILKFGGSLFIWNLPKWNSFAVETLNKYLSFRNMIAVDIKYSLPISGRLYPSHYSLLYYTKGKKPNVFNPDRVPMQTCPKCYNDLVDYGGYKNKMNPSGVNISDVWTDIPPVRHAKYKRRTGSNELSIKLLDRVIQMASNENDLVFDPFGGSGTTYIVSEIKKRRWIGTEIGPVDGIISRFEDIETEKEYIEIIRSNLNNLFTSKTVKERKKRNLWTTDTFANSLPEKGFELFMPEGSI